MIIFLDNAESILDPRGANAREIYAVVEELSEFGNICLCLTSRISTIPPTCERLDVPTLSVDAARDTFFRIYKNREQPDLVDGILEQLDFHPLSITLLATAAHQNRWNTNRLAEEWERGRTDALCTRHDNSLAATIELSLASPMFRALGPDARGLLGVVAFFPQGVDENNLDWLFPTLSNRTTIFDDFCILSLTYRSRGFITMFAPLRDYLSPNNPISSPLLGATKECYFHRLAVHVYPGTTGYEEARWIASEDVNVEHLLDAFTSVDINSVGAWDACASFMEHLYWHKRRLVTLGPKIEALQDDHPSKPACLSWLSCLSNSVGNHVEYKWLLTHALRLWREWGNDIRVGETLTHLSDANRHLGLYEEGVERAKEALGIHERLGDVRGQGQSLQQLAWMLYSTKQFDAAEEAALRVIDLLSDEANKFLVCYCYYLLGGVYRSKGETEKAIEHLETAIRIASNFNWSHHLFWSNFSLAWLLYHEKRFEDAHVHVERAKLHATNDPYRLGFAMELQACLWYSERKFEEAKSEALRAAEVFEGIRATKNVERCKYILRRIEEA